MCVMYMLCKRHRRLCLSRCGLVLAVVVSQDTNYKDAPTEGIRRVLQIVTGETIPRGELLKTDKIGMSYEYIVSILSFRIGHYDRLHSIIDDGGYECAIGTKRT